MIQQSKNHNTFLLVLLSAVALVVFFMIRPYIGTLLLALSFVILFQPAHKKILRITGYRESLAASVSMLCILILILLPLFFIGLRIIDETRQLNKTLNQNNNDVVVLAISHVRNSIEHLAPGVIVDFNGLTRTVLTWITQNLESIFSSFLTTLVNLLLTLLALFYFLRDGGHLKSWLNDISPLSSNEDAVIFEKLESTIRLIFRKSVIIGVIQGFLMGFGFMFFQVPNPTLLGSAAAITSLIPIVGTFFIIIPVCSFLILKGSLLSALGLLLWGSLVGLLSENFLSRVMLQKGLKIHTMFILLSVLGGLQLFGPIGFLLGPLVLSFFAVLLNIYLVRIRRIY